MYQLIIILHVLCALALIGLVLIQHGKGADVGAAFGSGASGTVFGSQGVGSFLFKMTSGLAIAFFLTSLALSSILSHQYHKASMIMTPAPHSSSAGEIPLPAQPGEESS